MLTDEQIENNKNKFIELLNKITREGADIPYLIESLQKSDFFTAPASTQYHCSYKGGLCEHSLNVYEYMNKLINMDYPNFEGCPYSQETLIIICLLHDFCKMNFYETSLRNVKDENGEWEQVPFIKVKDAKELFLFSHHGANSVYMIERFIPLKFQESVAIIHHMGWSDDHIDASTLSKIYNKYPLAVYLHTADYLSTFITERI